LRTRYILNRGATEEHEFEALVQLTSGRRSRPVLRLERIKTEVDHRISGETYSVISTERASTQEVERELNKRIADLMNADELNKEILLTDLLLNFHGPLTNFLVKTHKKEERNALVRHLWASADLLLQDELFSPSNRRLTDRKISQTASDAPIHDPCFRAITLLLTEPQVLSSEGSLEVAWRCLAIGHSDPETQRLASEAISLSSAWQMLARNRLPMNLIYFIGMRFKLKEPEELQKIFCDCTRSRLLEEIQRADNRKAIADLTKVILLLFEFGFMVETAYFERFDDLLTRFLQCVRQAGLKVDYFERIRAQLETARKEKGAPEGGAPKQIQGLPLSIQRRLAGESPYLFWFIGHPDTRVAMETLRHINLGNIEQVLKRPELNGELIRELLSKDELFGKPSTVFAALNHPKCTTEFGRRYMPRLRRTSQGEKALNSIAQSPSANSIIRGIARSMLKESRM
jgi:hypothetical protein